jgi:hypothetical protein
MTELQNCQSFKGAAERCKSCKDKLQGHAQQSRKDMHSGCKGSRGCKDTQSVGLRSWLD